MFFSLFGQKTTKKQDIHVIQNCYVLKKLLFYYGFIPKNLPEISSFVLFNKNRFKRHAVPNIGNRYVL